MCPIVVSGSFQASGPVFIMLQRRKKRHYFHLSLPQSCSSRPSLTTLCCYSVAKMYRLFVTPWAAAHQSPLPFTISRSLLKPMSIEQVMPSNHLILSPPSPAFNLSQHQGLFQLTTLAHTKITNLIVVICILRSTHQSGLCELYHSEAEIWLSQWRWDQVDSSSSWVDLSPKLALNLKLTKKLVLQGQLNNVKSQQASALSVWRPSQQKRLFSFFSALHTS